MTDVCVQARRVFKNQKKRAKNQKRQQHKAPHEMLNFPPPQSSPIISLPASTPSALTPLQTPITRLPMLPPITPDPFFTPTLFKALGAPAPSPNMTNQILQFPNFFQMGRPNLPPALPGFPQGHFANPPNQPGISQGRQVQEHPNIPQNKQEVPPSLPNLDLSSLSLPRDAAPASEPPRSSPKSGSQASFYPGSHLNTQKPF